MFVLVWWQGGSTFAFYRLVGRVAMMMFSAHRLLAWSLSNGALALSTVVVRLLLCPLVFACMLHALRCMAWASEEVETARCRYSWEAALQVFIRLASYGARDDRPSNEPPPVSAVLACGFRHCLREEIPGILEGLPFVGFGGKSSCFVVGSFFWWACCRLERSTHWSNSQASGSFKTMPYPGLTILVIGWDKILKVKIMSIMLRLILEKKCRRGTRGSSVHFWNILVQSCIRSTYTERPYVRQAKLVCLLHDIYYCTSVVCIDD
jgi:hypothetical protein